MVKNDKNKLVLLVIAFVSCNENKDVLKTISTNQLELLNVKVIETIFWMWHICTVT